MDWRKLLLSAEGRIGRKSYWLFVVLSIVVSLVSGALDALIFPQMKEGALFSGIAGLASVYPSICVQTKRLHDLGRSGWLQLLPLGGLVVAAPLVIAGGAIGAMLGGVIAVGVVGGMFVWVSFFKGQPGPNKYGEPNSGDRDVTPVVEVFS